MTDPPKTRASQASLFADEPPADERITVLRSELERLLELASGSPDLVGRSRLNWSRDDPAWQELGEEFNERLLDDLAARDDLSYEDCVRVLENVCGDLDERLPKHAGEALIRAWIRSDGSISNTDRWRRHVPWDHVRPADARRVLDNAVEHCMDAAFVHDEDRYALSFWVKTVAPVAFGDAAQRLEWLVKAIAERAGDDSDIGGSEESFIYMTWEWLGAIPKDDVRAKVRGFRALEDLAHSSLNESGEMSEGIAEAWSNFEWSAVPRALLAEVVAEAVPLALTAVKHGGQSEELRYWVGTVAPVVHPDLADRLLWFAEAVGKPAGDAPPFPEELNTSLTEYVCEWLEKLQRESIEDIAVVVRAFRRTSMSACVWKPDIDEALDSLSENLHRNDE